MSTKSCPLGVIFRKCLTKSLALYIMKIITFGGLYMFDKVKQILIDELQLDESEITLEAELSKDLGINSIELADLIMMCEEQFGIEISEDDANEFITVGDVVNYLEKL